MVNCRSRKLISLTPACLHHPCGSGPFARGRRVAAGQHPDACLASSAFSSSAFPFAAAKQQMIPAVTSSPLPCWEASSSHFGKFSARLFIPSGVQDLHEVAPHREETPAEC